MPLHLYFSFFSACALVLPMSYSSSLIFYFLLCWGLVLRMFYVSLFVFFLLMRLFLGFANVLCLFFIYIFSFLLCLWLNFANALTSFIFFFSLLPVFRFYQCAMPLYYIFSFLLCLCLCFANVICLFIYIDFLFFCVCGLVLPMLFVSLFFFSFVSVARIIQCSMPLYL